MMTQSCPELNKLECPRCNNTYKTSIELWSHMRDTYNNPTKCHVCGKIFNNLWNTLSHSYIHKKIKPYKCIKCNNFDARTKQQINTHLLTCGPQKKLKRKSRINKNHRNVSNNNNNNNTNRNVKLEDKKVESDVTNINDLKTFVHIRSNVFEYFI